MAIQNYQQQIPQITPQYSQQVIPQVQIQQPQQYNQLPTVGVFWVQGVEGAKGYQVNTANTEVYLRDTEDNDILYVKTTDQFGRPNSLRRFRLNEEEIEPQVITTTTEDFVTVDQLNDILDEKLNKFAEKLRPQNHKRNNGSRRNNNRRYEEDEYDEAE